jgi:hypothetical protein
MFDFTNTAHDHKVCCFCSRELPLEIRVCPCGEYKGIMTVEHYEDYLKEAWDCDCVVSDPYDKVNS